MSRFSSFVLFLSLLMFFFSISSLLAQEKGKIDWDKYSERLVEALKSSHEGLQLSAMQNAIRYGDSLNVVFIEQPDLEGSNLLWLTNTNCF